MTEEGTRVEGGGDLNSDDEEMEQSEQDEENYEEFPLFAPP